ncbi:hypothetical protein DERP_003079 [Dermatophagoides pteronyssinus]|uniref:Uncharacterized protein n=1 Tax=Dermatophagoides pteronyssinus TaxID=6956 RepID=A0ABQ8JIZ2_DERPT|nr:hypothetical protein DERP_003079 [Dermatophagoides pteronyssinus]
MYLSYDDNMFVNEMYSHIKKRKQQQNEITLNKWPVYGKSSFMYDIHFFASISVDNQHGKNT